MLKFGLIGVGEISKYHRRAIQEIGGRIEEIYDPLLSNLRSLDNFPFYDVDYVVICSPTQFHRDQTELVLAVGCSLKVIVEKPAVLPWQQLIDNPGVNIVMQLRYAEEIPKQAQEVAVRMVRAPGYFNSWKGNISTTGGIGYHLFIHYIDLALSLGAEFHGELATEGENFRRVDDFDLYQVDMQKAYNAMYHDIVSGGGVKPADLKPVYSLLDKIRPCSMNISQDEIKGVKVDK